MMIRSILLICGCLLVSTSLADAALRHRHWVTVRHYVGPTCHCGVHACGEYWMEGGTKHRCVRADKVSKRKKR